MTVVARTSHTKAVCRTEPERALSLLPMRWPKELAVLPDEADRRMLNDDLVMLLAGVLCSSESGEELAKILVSGAVNLWQDLAPQDAIERGLVIAAIRIEIAARMNGRRAVPGTGDPSPGIRDLLRLTSASAKLLEQLDRRRRGVQQRVVVEHVHVEAGGQAIVGAVGLDGGRVRAGKGR